MEKTEIIINAIEGLGNVAGLSFSENQDYEQQGEDDLREEFGENSEE